MAEVPTKPRRLIPESASLDEVEVNAHVYMVQEFLEGWLRTMYQ